MQLGLRYGMVLFIVSEVMFFVAWFWAFFDASLFSNEAIQVARVEYTGGHWPPTGVEVFDPWHLPLVNTIILLSVRICFCRIRYYIVRDSKSTLKYNLLIVLNFL